MILWLRSLLFLIIWAATTLALGFLCLPCLLSRRASTLFSWLWAKCTLWALHAICGLKTQVEGREYFPAHGGIIASKHQSTWDTIVLWHELKNPVFVLKRQLYWIPVFGWYLWRTGQIAIDRKGGRAVMEQVITGAQKAMAHGRTLVMFPEGTRVKLSATPPFRGGISRVSAVLNLPVTPVALNAARFWPKLSLTKKPGLAVLRALPPMPPCGSEQSAWLADLQQRINSETAKLGG